MRAFFATIQVTALLTLALGNLAIAQVDCGVNPEQNIAWSSNFKKATLHYECSSTNASATGIGEAGYITGSFDHNACTTDTLDDQTAYTYVQTELANQRAAIVATCGFYACKMASTPGSIPNIAALSGVWSQALQPGGAPGSAANLSLTDFKVVPAFMPFIPKAPSQSIRIYLENTSNGKLTFDRPQSLGGEASVTKPLGSTFNVPPHSGLYMTVLLKKPGGTDLPELVSLPVVVHGSAADKAVVNFSLGTSPSDFLPPISLTCGRLNPHMTATAYDDQDPGGQPKTFETNAFADVPAGQVIGWQKQGSEYHYNGGGEISISMDSSCTQLDSTRNHAAVVVAFSTKTSALSGHCCPGQGPGGMGATDPEWINDFTLPGSVGKNKWNVSVVMSTTLAGQGARLHTRHGWNPSSY
jgi:hypothetical protein